MRPGPLVNHLTPADLRRDEPVLPRIAHLLRPYRGKIGLVLIAVVALIAIGPKELPGVLRTVGQWMGKARKMAAEFQGQFQEALREAEMADLKKSFDEVREAASGFSGGNLISSLQKDVSNSLRWLSMSSGRTTTLTAPVSSSMETKMMPPAVPGRWRTVTMPHARASLRSGYWLKAAAVSKRRCCNCGRSRASGWRRRVSRRDR